jgi:PAS domain S-box-containing protein
VVDTAVDAIITIDEQGRIESVNPATERLFGYARDEMVGQHVMRLMPEAYRGEYEGHLRRYLRTGEARVIGLGGEVFGLRKDGSTLPLSLSVSEFRVDGRRMFTGILHDVTERRRLERHPGHQRRRAAPDRAGPARRAVPGTGRRRIRRQAPGRPTPEHPTR